MYGVLIMIIINKKAIFNKVDKLKYPLIIKPATLGSSIGIQVVNNLEELDTIITEVFKYDRKILIEEKIEDLKELNISVLKTNDKIFTSSIEQIETNLIYREYNDKYKLDNYINGNIIRTNPANISEKLENEIIDLAKKTTNLLNNTGLCTIDFLYDNNNKKLYIDEINNIPTCYSHHLWETANISYRELLTILINDTLKNINKDTHIIKTMDMNILKGLKTKDIKEMK